MRGGGKKESGLRKYGDKVMVDWNERLPPIPWAELILFPDREK
jgi:hypothetical protein